MKDTEQADKAVDYINYCSNIEQPFETSQKRELTKLETDVRESALTCLLSYFNAFPEVENIKTAKVKRKRKVKKNLKDH